MGGTDIIIEKVNVLLLSPCRCDLTRGPLTASLTRSTVTFELLVSAGTAVGFLPVHDHLVH